MNCENHNFWFCHFPALEGAAATVSGKTRESYEVARGHFYRMTEDLENIIPRACDDADGIFFLGTQKWYERLKGFSWSPAPASKKNLEMELDGKLERGDSFYDDVVSFPLKREVYVCRTIIYAFIVFTVDAGMHLHWKRFRCAKKSL